MVLAMDLRQLQAIVAIAEQGSFSAAADALSTVQSNVSTHVKKLERELGTQLVDRASGQLTDAGALVVARAKRVLRELDALTADVTALSQEIVGTVRVGAIGTAARWLVPQLVDITPLRHPQLHLVFVEATTTGLGEQLSSGQVDVGVLALPGGGPEIRTIPLYEEDLVLVVPRDHPFAEHQSVPLAALAGIPLFLPLPGTAFRDELDAQAEAAGITLRAKAEMDSVRLMASLTFDRAGYSVLPAGAIPAYLQSSFAQLPIVGLPPRLVGVAQRRRGLPGAPVRAVLEILSEIIYDPDRVPAGVRPVGAAAAHPPIVPIAGPFARRHDESSAG
jgi:LysR family hydrogen peroxide-inducible transcriptional activator